jgi:hypothetical protein
MPLADVFVSNDVLVKLITENVRPSRDLEGVDVKSLDIIKLGQLYAMLTGKAFLDLLPGFPEIHAVSDDGPWVYRLPAMLQSILADLAEPKLSATAERWAQIPEFALDKVGSAAVATMLGDLCRLARLAQAGGERMYLWNSV